jgi:lipopolysaccharide/colanic/teichoic acid biosynthesis glycosyltransferase
MCCIPIILVAIVFIFIDDRGPVFFVQTRVGYNLKQFHIYKLRTMTNEKHLVGDKPIIGKAEGVTRIGYVLRRFKIDELPQLFNVLRGEMSIVGPRPGVPDQLQEMSGIHKSRYSAKPGLTGLAQVSGNIHLPRMVRYNLDIKYIATMSFVNDIRILLRTILIIMVGEAFFVNKPLKLR